MSFHGFDPGDYNNWYQSPHLGLFPTSSVAYGGGISGRYYSSSYHSYGSSTRESTQFSSQPNPYPPLQLNPSTTIINGHLLPHQFPCVPQTHSQVFPPPYLQPIHPIAQQPLTITPRSPSIPHSNPNPWIYPPISQSLCYEPHSQSASTKSMTTTPIYNSPPPPLACEQPHTIADPKPLCPIPEYDRICLETDRVHNWELPIVDSGCYSFTPEPMAKLKGVEKPQSPPRGSCELQVNKDHTDAKLREMQKSCEISMDTFMSEFREELRLLRGSSQSPVIQVDNTPKFRSQSNSTIATSLTASGKPSSSSTATAGGSIRILEPNFNLSPHEAILELNNDVSVVVVSGSSSEDNIDVGMTEKLVLNVDKNIVGSATGVKLSDSHGSDVANSIVWGNDAQTQHTSFRNGSSAGYGELGSHNHNLVGSLRVDFHERDEKELEDEYGEDDNEDEGENDGAKSYGDGSLSYSDDSQSVNGQIVIDSSEEVVIDEEGSRLCIKKEALLGDSEFIHDKDHLLEDHKQSIIVTDFPQLLWDEGNFSQVTILNPKLEATLLNRNLVESFATIAVSMLDFSQHASKHKTIDFEQFILYHFGISELMATLVVANLQACLPNWKVRVKFSTSSHKGNFEYDLHITNLIESMRINAQNLFVHMHEKQIGTKSSALHCFGFINSISNIGIQTIVPSTSHVWDFQTHQLRPPLPTSGHFEVINFAKGLLAFQIYFSIGTIGSKMTVIASIGEICNQILQPQMCNSIFVADSTKLSPFVLVILDIELHNQESLSRPLFRANLLLCSSLDSDDFRSAVFNFFHHWLCIVLVQAFAKSEGLLNHDLEAPGPHEWLAVAIEIGNPYALILAQKMGEKVYVASARFGKLLPDPFIPSKLFYTDEDIPKTFECNCEVIIEGSHLPSSHDCKHLPFDALLLLVPRLSSSHIPFCLSSKVVQCITAMIACVVFLTAAYVSYKLRVCCCTEKDLKPAKNGRSGSLFQKYIGQILHVASILVINDELVKHFSHTKSASTPLRYCSSSAISIVATLLPSMVLVMCVTACGVLKTLEKAHIDGIVEKAKKKQLDVVLRLGKDESFFTILLQHGIPMVGEEFRSDIFSMQPAGLGKKMCRLGHGKAHNFCNLSADSHTLGLLIINRASAFLQLRVTQIVQINRVVNICLEHCIVFLEKKGVKNVHKWGWYKLQIVGNGISLVFAPSIQDNEEDGGLIVNDEDVGAGVVLHDDGIMIVEDDITDGDKEPTIPLLWNMFVHLQQPFLVKKATLAYETCKIQETMDGSINADSPPIFSSFHDQALIMILYSLRLIRAWQKSMGYLPFEDSNYPTMPWFSYIFLDLWVTLCSGHIAADTTNGYGFQMISCKSAQILIQNMKLEDKFV